MSGAPAVAPGSRQNRFIHWQGIFREFGIYQPSTAWPPSSGFLYQPSTINQIAVVANYAIPHFSAKMPA
jgi:hypothetical protein